MRFFMNSLLVISLNIFAKNSNTLSSEHTQFIPRSYSLLLYHPQQSRAYLTQLNTGYK